jgi:hypothetical protein
LAYACGDIGESGVGTVFYASATPFVCGANMGSMCNYLEVAPNGWNGTLVKCIGGCGGSDNKTSDWGSGGAGAGKGYFYCSREIEDPKGNIPNVFGTVVGSGYSNTSALLSWPYCDIKPVEVRDYTGGGKSDWSLPSKDELNALFYYPNRTAIGGFAASEYWTSTQSSQETNPGGLLLKAWVSDFSSGAPSSQAKNMRNGLRPIRAF